MWEIGPAPVPAQITDLDAARLDAALAQRAPRARRVLLPEDLLIRLGLAASTAERGVVPSYAGLLLLGRQPQAILPQSRVACQGAGGRDHAEILTGPVPDLLAGALAWLATQPPAQAIPPGVLQEVLVNALIHRDWSRPASIQVTVTATQVHVVSPGPWVEAIRSPEMVCAAGGRSLRAPILVDLWRTALGGPIPDLGLGLDLIQRALAAAGLPAAIWRATTQAVAVQLGTHRPSEAPTAE